MRIVVTGALGHIGSRLIRAFPRLLPDGELLMVDDLSTSRFPSLFDLPEPDRYRFVEADVTKVDLRPLFDGAIAVVHLAAITDATSSFENRERVESINLTATERVAEACIETGAAMIMASTTSVYGTQKDRVDKDCDESDLKPQSPYAETKLREERLLGDLHVHRGLRTVICRLGTIAGTSTGMRFHTAVNKFCWQAVMGQPLTIWRTAYDQKRPYLDLSDAVRGFGFLIRRGRFEGELFNVVSENLTVRQVVDRIRDHVPELNVKLVDSAIMNQLSYEVDSSRIGDIGFAFKGSIGAAIADTIGLLRAANGLPAPMVAATLGG